MISLEHPVPIEINKIDLIKFQIEWTLKGQIKLTRSEIYTLVYVYLHGRDAISKMVEDKVVKNSKTVENYLSKFRKNGLIEGTGTGTKLNQNIRPVVDDISFTIRFKLRDGEGVSQ